MFVDEESFRLALEADPENCGLWLIYSDWLEEQGRAEESAFYQEHSSNSTMMMIFYYLSKPSRSGRSYVKAALEAFNAAIASPAPRLAPEPPLTSATAEPQSQSE